MRRFQPKVFMFVPTMACQAGCRYCYARKSGDRMSPETAVKAVDFIERFAADGSFKIIFHGGEPLLAGEEFYRFILPVIRERFGRRAGLGIQSNLWAMDEKMAHLLRAYEVEVGTSIDGYREMCDDQRGAGYYDRTQAGADNVRTMGGHVGRICTFSAAHAGDAERVYREAESGYTIHAAIPTYGEEKSPLSLSPGQFAGVLADTYHAYRSDLSHARVGLLDSMASALLKKKAGLCTFSDCLGRYAAITPDGSVYSCQRFSGIRQFCLGNIWDELTEEDILKSPAFRMLEEKAERMKSVCGDCQHFPSCNGGCLYSAFTADSDKDPNCAAYKTVFDEMLVDMGHEILDVLNHRGNPTPVLSMAGDQPHPFDRREKLGQIRKALEKGKLPENNEDAPFFPENQLNKVFFNLTRKCPLHCTHCWAGNQKSEGAELPPERYAELTAQAVDMRFRHIIFTGGEPFVYKGFERLTDLLCGIDRKGAELVLRTSFAFRISDDMLQRIAKVFDRVIVSVDGDRDAHDARRGAGSYEKTVANLERFAKIADSRKLGLWTVLDMAGQSGEAREAVRKLGRRLEVGLVHFDGMKPLGNACFRECDLTSDLPERAEDLRIRRNCGLGHILHVEPDGKAYACYACMGGPDAVLADLSADPLNSVCGRLFGYARSGVDTNEKCSACPVRYLCGGLCLAYRPHPEDPDNGDFDCGSRLQKLKELTADLEG